MPKKLTRIEIGRSLKRVPRWRKSGRVIRRTYEFKDFVAAMKFVTDVARTAEKAWHHPDIDIRWTTITFALVTHAMGGLTEYDFNMAGKIDEVVDKAQ